MKKYLTLLLVVAGMTLMSPAFVDNLEKVEVFNV